MVEFLDRRFPRPVADDLIIAQRFIAGSIGISNYGLVETAGVFQPFLAELVTLIQLYPALKRLAISVRSLRDYLSAYMEN